MARIRIIVQAQLAHLLLLVAAAFILGANPAFAHKKEHRDEAVAGTPGPAQQAGTIPDGSSEAEAANHMAAMMEEEKQGRSSMSAGERLLDWLGRLHPVIIHFPLAFFPAALFTAIVGRRRPAFARPVQFLVVAGGIVAPIAALLGWFAAVSADQGPLLTVHRWLGTAIGVAGLALAIWAWKRPWEDRRPAMLRALAAITAAIAVQGWYGGAIVHGVGHLNW